MKCLAGFVLIFCCFNVAGIETIANKEIHVYIEEQVLIAYENGEEVYSFDIITGRDDKETMAGKDKVFRKHEKYTSRTYESGMPSIPCCAVLAFRQDFFRLV